tara:strand:+ start:197 stop:1294 length:1098 start_codon:yes stop_codon:yes gene_type:complete
MKDSDIDWGTGDVPGGSYPSALRDKTPRTSMPVYDEDCLSDGEALRLEKIADPVDRENYLCGAMGQRRPPFDCPGYSLNPGREVVMGGPDQGAGNAWIVFGLDRPSYPDSGFGGLKASHCAAIDIVVGRGASYAAAREGDGSPILMGPTFNGPSADAARIYLSQRAGVDQYFNLPDGNVGNVTMKDPRSTVAMKADTLRFIARENIKFVTRAEDRNSQGGVLGNGYSGGYGIDLIACGDVSTLQPMVRGDNLRKCLGDITDLISTILAVVNTLVVETRKLHKKVMPHDHHAPFYGNKTAPDFAGLIPEGLKVMLNNITQTDVGIQQLQMLVQQIELAYGFTNAPVAVVDGNKKSLNILSPYNSNN